MPKLTNSQRAWLLKLSSGPRSRPYGDNFRAFDRVMAALVALGFAAEGYDGEYVITAAGSGALRREFAGVHVFDIGSFEVHTCRLCGESELGCEIGRMVRYSTRAWAHARCYVRRVGVEALWFLPEHTLRDLPVMQLDTNDARVAMSISSVRRGADGDECERTREARQ